MMPGQPLLLGQYRPLGSYLHRLDARSKIIPITLVLVLALLTTSFTFYTVILAALVVGLMVSGVRLSALLRNLRPILILVLITMVYHLLFSSAGGETLVSLGSFDVTTGAVHQAAFFSLRLVLFVVVAFLLTFTNSPSELAEALAKLFSPLKRLRVPVMEMAMILFIAIRFVPILFEEFHSIRNAQITRGVSFSGSLMARIRKATVIIVPVFLAALQRADELALAIQARGYDGSSARTFYSRTSFGQREVVFSVSSGIFLLALFWVTK